MANQHISSALLAPAPSAAYPMAKPGYGKRSVPGQRPRTRDDFDLLPTRERYVAGFVDHLPEGAAMSVKQLAKQLPLYGQQAISTALNALSVAGHLRRVRCAVGTGEETRWVFRTFWSRTAHDNEWWNTYLATENTPEPVGPAPHVPHVPAPDTTPPPPPWAPTEEPPPAPPESPGTEQAPATAPQSPAPSAVPHQRAPLPAPFTAPPKLATSLSPAYLALAHLGRKDDRLALSEDDCTALEAQAAEWLTRGVSVDYLTSALTAGLPAKVDCPVGFVRRRLTDKMPPRLPTQNTSPATPAPASARRILIECTDCGRPGQPEALPDGLCRPCHTTHRAEADNDPIQPAEAAKAADIKARMANLRDLLKPV
ncbi:MarR family transcriptional regulator [Streptomyces sp. NPDC059452]|uniref:MarR family transcriptional regulator n=1 Tax=Streptomyces sp. NPDC059452 TaxID=3346835 RepID=UPI00367649BA